MGSVCVVLSQVPAAVAGFVGWQVVPSPHPCGRRLALRGPLWHCCGWSAGQGESARGWGRQSGRLSPELAPPGKSVPPDAVCGCGWKDGGSRLPTGPLPSWAVPGLPCPEPRPPTGPPQPCALPTSPSLLLAGRAGARTKYHTLAPPGGGEAPGVQWKAVPPGGPAGGGWGYFCGSCLRAEPQWSTWQGLGSHWDARAGGAHVPRSCLSPRDKPAGVDGLCAPLCP